MASADGARIIGTLASQHRDALAALYAPRAAFFDLRSLSPAFGAQTPRAA